MGNRHFAVVALVIASLFWAVSGVSWKFFLAAGFAFIFIFLVSRLFKFLTVLFVSYYRVKRHEPIKSWKELALIFLNAVFSVATPFFFVLAISHTTIANAYFLQYTLPAWVLVAAVAMLGEKLDWKKIASVGLAILGILFVAKPGDLLAFNPGVLFGLLSAFSHAGDIITSRELKGYSYHTISVYSNGMQVLVSLALLPFFPWPSSIESHFPAILAIAVVGVVLGVASDLYYLALHVLEASKAAIINFLELLFAAIMAFMLFSEVPSSTELLGYALIIIASTMIVLRKADIENFERLLRFTDRA